MQAIFLVRVTALATGQRVLDLDETRSSQSHSGDIIGSCNVARGSQSSVGEALSNKLLKGELGLDADTVSIPLDILSLDAVGKLLASGVGDVEVLALVRLVESGAERKSLVLGIENSDSSTVDRQSREDGQVDVLDVLIARSRDDKALESRPGKGSGDSGQEGRL